jgi:Ni2+-binding GTPase involved in maturation of urease and hydrogenase
MTQDYAKNDGLIYGPPGSGRTAFIKKNGVWEEYGVSVISDDERESVIDVTPLENKTTRPAVCPHFPKSAT